MNESDQPVIRRRTNNERSAYLEGLAVGVELALQEVRRLNFSDVAERARPNITVRLELINTTVEGGQ